MGVRMVMFLKEEQFPELRLISMRIIMGVMMPQRLADKLVEWGIFNALLDLMRHEEEVMRMYAVWLLRKVAAKVSNVQWVPDRARVESIVGIIGHQ